MLLLPITMVIVIGETPVSIGFTTVIIEKGV